MKIIITKGSQKGKILEREKPEDVLILKQLVKQGKATIYKELKEETETKELKIRRKKK